MKQFHGYTIAVGAVLALAVALQLTAAPVEWEFPRLGSCHEGMAFSDGVTGVLVWGGGDEIRLTVGRADLWDHRGGYAWTAEQSYTNIVALVRQCMVKVEMTAQQKGHQLNALFDERMNIRVLMDKDRMEQVILNVLTNAIKYTPDGGRIDVDIDSNGRDVQIIVSDNGIGISEDELPRIFERFYRVDKARSRKMGGTGLGLAITKQIVEEHQGTITAESTLGKGTKFIITLRVATHRGTPNIE